MQRYSFFLKHRQNRSKTFLKHRQNRSKTFLKHRQNRSKTFLKHRQNRSKTFLKHRQQTAKLPHNWSFVPVLLFVVPVAPKCCSGAAGVLFRCYRSFIPALPEFYYSSAGISIIRSFQTSYHSSRRCIYRQDWAESRPLSI